MSSALQCENFSLAFVLPTKLRNILHEAPYINMPEPFSVTVGAVAVTNILIDNILKLKKLTDGLKGLPVKLSVLVTQLQILSETLGVIENVHRQGPGLETTPISNQITAICNDLINELSEIAFEVQNALKNRTLLINGWIKAALKDHKIKDLEQRLSQTLQLVIAVNQTTLLKVLRHPTAAHKLIDLIVYVKAVKHNDIAM